jgi:colanic acid biosynthesis glycosyl transferase WcaI
VSGITIWSPNYAPELTGIPPLVTDAAEWLAARGHGVRVVTAFPNYPSRVIPPEYRGAFSRAEDRHSVEVRRTWLRVRPRESFLDKALYELTFSTASLPFAARAARHSDVLVCLVPTLLATAYSRLLKVVFPRLRVVLWVQDLVAEGAAALDLSPSQLIALRFARKLEALAVRGADRVVVCSPGFAGHLVRHGLPAERVETILNWADTVRIAPIERKDRRGPARFLYAGNLGYSQGLETLIEGARLAGSACAVQIVGDGNAADEVRRRAASVDSVVVEPPVREETYPRLLADADVHVVMQRRVSAGANLPSKIATALASGRPILASIASATPAADLLEQSGGAIVVEPESPVRLAEAMRALAADVNLREALGRRGRSFAEVRLSKPAALAALEAAIVGRPSA